MKRTIIISFIIILLFLLSTTGALLYLYSSSGNTKVASYLERRILKETGLPIKFERFELERGYLYFVALLYDEASLGFNGSFNIFTRSFNGKYLLKVTNAKYHKYTLRQANIVGNIQGVADDMHIDGNGTLLNGPIVYKLAVKEKKPQNLTLQLRNIPITELLSLTDIPRIIKGQIDADILMPSIGRDDSKGKAIIQIRSAHFDPVVLRKLYDYILPPDKISLKGEFKATLNGNRGTFGGKIISDLITAYVKNGQANLAENAVACDMVLDAKELLPLTQSRFRGPLKLKGGIKYDTLGLRIKAKTDSLGGTIDIDYTDRISAKIVNVSLSKMLYMLTLPDLAKGRIDGRMQLDSFKAQKGDYVLKLSEGKIHSKVLNNEFGTILPDIASLKFESKGDFTSGVLNTESVVLSNLFTIAAKNSRYDISSGKFTTDYRAHIPDPLALAGKKGKKVPVVLTGKVVKEKNLHIVGDAKGLGKRLSFDYSGEALKIIGDDVNVERVLASLGQPIYLNGVADFSADFPTIKPLDGKLSINASMLKLDPLEIERITGKPIDTTISLSLKGVAQKGSFYGKSIIKSSLANITMPKISYFSKNSFFSTPFHIDVTDLSKLDPFTGAKLKGSFISDGQISSGAQISLSGSSTSLGGELSYRYKGNQTYIKLTSVSLQKLLYLIDQPQQLLGDLNASFRYNIASKKGDIHATVDKFQFKPCKFTTAAKMILQKDLTQVIYRHTATDAVIKGDKISYKITARGKRSDFVIKDGLLNTTQKTNKASYGLRVDDIDVIGTIRGPIIDPKVSVLPGRMMHNKLKNKIFIKAKGKR